MTRQQQDCVRIDIALDSIETVLQTLDWDESMELFKRFRLELVKSVREFHRLQDAADEHATQAVNEKKK